MALYWTAHFDADGIRIRARRLALRRAFAERFVLSATDRIDERAVAFLDAFPCRIANESALALALWRAAGCDALDDRTVARRFALRRAIAECLIVTAAIGIDEGALTRLDTLTSFPRSDVSALALTLWRLAHLDAGGASVLAGRLTSAAFSKLFVLYTVGDIDGRTVAVLYAFPLRIADEAGRALALRWSARRNALNDRACARRFAL